MTSRRTAKALAQQLDTLASKSFELGIYNAHSGLMIQRRWTSHQIMRSVPWLRHRNAQGCDIYLRPHGPFGTILLDDLVPNTIADLHDQGFPPATLIQTSPGNLQAWIRLIDNVERKPLPTLLLTKAAQALARHFHADLAAADWRHYGRAVGFTNRKHIHRTKGQYPYTLLLESRGRAAPSGRHLLLRMLHAIKTTTPTRRRSLPHKTQAPIHPVDLYRQVRKHILFINRHQSWVANPDRSRLDYMIAGQLQRAGYEPKHIEHVLLTGSPQLTLRKNGHELHYVQRTVQKVLSPPNIETRSQHHTRVYTTLD